MPGGVHAFTRNSDSRFTTGVTDAANHVIINAFPRNPSTPDVHPFIYHQHLPDYKLISIIIGVLSQIHHHSTCLWLPGLITRAITSSKHVFFMLQFWREMKAFSCETSFTSSMIFDRSRTIYDYDPALCKSLPPTDSHLCLLTAYIISQSADVQLNNMPPKWEGPLKGFYIAHSRGHFSAHST